MKKIVSMVFLALFITLLSFPAYAAQRPRNNSPDSHVHVNYVNIASLNAGLSLNSSGKATCTGSVTLYSKSNTAQLSVQLQKYSSGSWSTLYTWSATARGTSPTNIVKSYNVARGQYRVSTTAKVYNASGTLLETQTARSATRTY